MTIYRCRLLLVVFVCLFSNLTMNALAERKRYSKGLVTSSLCPYSCRTQGIPKKHCKDWKQNNRCFVEDLTRPPAKFNPVSPSRPVNPAGIKSSGSSTQSTPSSSKSIISDINKRLGFSGSNSQELDPNCKGKAPYQLAQPIIDIIRARKTGGIAKNRYKIDGSIEGVCLVEAGYYEEGILKIKIPTKTIQHFKRYPFTINVRPNHRPEIRVYNSAGERASTPIEVKNY